MLQTANSKLQDKLNELKRNAIALAKPDAAKIVAARAIKYLEAS